MVRKNEKQKVTSYENSIRKSNELSMAKLNHGLTLNQMQLLAFAIFSTQQNGVTEFRKVDFEKKFSIEQYKTQHAKEDAQKVMGIMFSCEDLENDTFEFWNVFRKMKYENGTFRFLWDEEMLPHILELKEKYITTDLTITSQFRSGFSWTLYDYLRAHYGYWHKPISKEALMKLLDVENVKSYKNNTGLLKRKVLDVAVEEINKYTELEVRYNLEKEGRTIIGFDLIWSTGTNQTSATKKQIQELKAIINTVKEDMFKYINLDEEKKRNQAIELIKQTQRMEIYTEEPVCITKDRADKLITDANYALQKLEQLTEPTNDVLSYNPYKKE